MGLSSIVFGSKSDVPVPMVLYTRPVCPLCDEMKAVIAGARLVEPYAFREVDVDEDRELKKRFGLRIPVLEIAGEVAFEGRVERAQLEKAYRRSARRWRAGFLHSSEGS